MPDAPPLAPFVLASEVTDGHELPGDAVIDLAEYAHPDETLRALAVLSRAKFGALTEATLVVPAAGAAPVLASAAGLGAGTIALNGVETAAQVQAASQALDASNDGEARLVLRLTSGAGLHRCEELIAASERVSAIWYAPADLLVDFDDEPSDLYVYDSDEPRLAAPGWTRSRCLTVARASDVELWGQLDISFAYAPRPPELAETLRLAALSGFQRVVSRYPDSY
jgi:citrate lyase beta subunit